MEGARPLPRHSYQGTKVWGFTGLIPIIGGPVDFGLRLTLLKSIQEQVTGSPVSAFLQALLDNWASLAVPMG